MTQLSDLYGFEEKPREMRDRAVAVAQDVLHRLQLGTLKLTGGAYLYYFGAEDLSGSLDSPLQPQIDEAESNCVVCGMGALFLSYVRKFNQCTRSQIYHSPGFEPVAATLEPAFSSRELVVIEAAFQGWSGKVPEEDFVAFTEYVATHTHPERWYASRLTAICQNIVANDGVFLIPELVA